MKVEIQRSEKLNTLGELAASIAHEVRNPLTVVKGFLQLMQQEEKGKNYDYLSLVLSELGRAESIINDYFQNPKANRPSCIYLYCRYREGNESWTDFSDRDFVLYNKG